MPWAKVSRVDVFKRDLFTTDLVCMFLQGADQSAVEIHEEMDGWVPFIEALPERLPGCEKDWFPRVAHPAFATNMETIFLRRHSLPRS